MRMSFILLIRMMKSTGQLQQLLCLNTNSNLCVSKKVIKLNKNERVSVR